MPHTDHQPDSTEDLYNLVPNRPNGQKSAVQNVMTSQWNLPWTFWIQNVMNLLPLSFVWNFVIIIIWIIDLWLKMCLIGHGRLELWFLSTKKLSSVPHLSTFVSNLKKFHKVQSRAIKFTKLGWTGCPSHTDLSNFNHHNLISSFSGPGECVCQFQRNPFLQGS